ncbi:hypothetical protein K505DRAFT_295128 [Melanomma pulvis-pyrius CBS 109.77]|uniref:Rhodopsin domain-containing protein n=1 Tax=Melanomma pulvis-pyrius CBS 109.77 TaxID=1314802 RepID=A0A6A6XRW1_9PLEO|nr:hypothetical protein K505DRAFT_295128 [Melanomma pulvis-pyrius CBS 109.77]
MATEVPTHAPRQTNAYVCVSITFISATIAVVCRLIARRLTRLQLAYDDYLTLVAFIFAVAWTGLVLWWLKIGLGRYLAEISTPSDLVLLRSRLVLFHVEIAYALSLGFSKLAILAFYWRMFKTSKIKIPIQVLAVATIIWLILRTFMAVFHCVPVQKFWYPEVSGVCNINDSQFFGKSCFGTVLTHLIIDLTILALPVIEVYKLYLPLYQRLGIMSMFLFGIFVCVASIVVLVYSFFYDTSSLEMPWNITPIIIWATVEVNLAIVSACLPTLRPIFLIIIGQSLPKSPSVNTYNASRSHKKSFSGHRLATLTTHKDLDRSDTDSMHQLAKVPTRNESISSLSDYNSGGHGITTTVAAGSLEDGERLVLEEAGEGGRKGLEGLGGIVVSREMSVRISKV